MLCGKRETGILAGVRTAHKAAAAGTYHPIMGVVYVESILHDRNIAF